MTFKEISYGIILCKQKIIKQGGAQPPPAKGAIMANFLRDHKKTENEWKIIRELSFFDGIPIQQLLLNRPRISIFPWMSGLIKQYYIKYFAILFLEDISSEIDWYRKHGSLSISAEDEVARMTYFSELKVHPADYPAEEYSIYVTLKEIAKLFQSGVFNRIHSRNPINDNYIREIFSQKPYLFTRFHHEDATVS
jgi:hypothetical protein